MILPVPDMRGEFSKTRFLPALVWIPLLLTSLGVMEPSRAAGAELPGGRAPGVSDQAFFSALLLEGAATEEARAAVEHADWALARRAVGTYFRERQLPQWAMDGASQGDAQNGVREAELDDADRIAGNEFVSVGIPHQFGADIQWDANPTPDRYPEWTWQLNRHRFWKTLARAYRQTGDEKYARAFVAQLRDWVADNPVPEGRAANGPGSTWRTIDAGIRMSGPWMDAFFAFRSSPFVTDDDLILLLKSILEHARYLARFPSKGGNWVTHEMKGLYTIGVLFPEFRESGGWRDRAMKRLSDELTTQVYPDGVQFELSTDYHHIVLQNFADTVRLAQRNSHPLPSGFLDRIERMYAYELLAAMPDGRLPPINDSRPTDVRKSLRGGYELFPHRTDFLWFATGGAEGTPPTASSSAFPYAGQFVMRSGWAPDSRYLLFDAGPFGYGHQHEDKLSFVLFAYGRPLVVDPGSYAYDSSSWRRYVTSSFAHNVVHIDDNEQHRRGLPRRRYVVKTPQPVVWDTTPEFDYVAASFGREPDEGFGEGRRSVGVHTRHILFVKKRQGQPAGDYWFVADVLAPADSSQHRYEAFFHLDVERVAASADDKKVVSADPDRANVAVIPAHDDKLSVDVIRGQVSPHVQGWVSDGARSVRPIPTVVFRKEGSALQYFLTIFYPFREGEELPVRSVQAIRTSRDEISLRVRFRDGGEDELHVGRKPAVLRISDADARPALQAPALPDLPVR